MKHLVNLLVFCLYLASSAAADSLHPIPFNYGEEREIVLSECDEQRITEAEIRALSAQRYALRQQATSELVARLSIQVSGPPLLLYCRLARVTDALQKALVWARQQELTHEFAPLEVERRLEQIGKLSVARFEKQAEAYWQDAETTRSKLNFIIARGNPEQAAYKTVQRWESFECTLSAVRCAMIPPIFNSHESLQRYLEVPVLWSCETLSSDCASFTPEIAETGYTGKYSCPVNFKLVEIPSEHDADTKVPSHCKRTKPAPMPAQKAGTCNSLEPDTDGDEVPDREDGCPIDPAKTSAEANGCNEPEICEDSDSDGMSDCTDECWLDPEKTTSGIYGCGISDSDSDNDGTPDFDDLCPNDPQKRVPETCGCGVDDMDSDWDGRPDCRDTCPFDSSVSTDSETRCSCRCIDGAGLAVAAASDHLSWTLSSIEGRSACAAQNGQRCRNSSTGAQGFFSSCGLGTEPRTSDPVSTSSHYPIPNSVLSPAA